MSSTAESGSTVGPYVMPDEPGEVELWVAEVMALSDQLERAGVFAEFALTAPPVVYQFSENGV